MKLYIFIILLLSLSSCSLTKKDLTQKLTQEEQKVRITQNSSTLAQCSPVKTITVKPPFVSGSLGTWKEQWMSPDTWVSSAWRPKLKEAVVKAGGNAVFVGTLPSMENKNILAEIYNCENKK